jgi:hypothetical protein
MYKQKFFFCDYQADQRKQALPCHPLLFCCHATLNSTVIKSILKVNMFGICIDNLDFCSRLQL